MLSAVHAGVPRPRTSHALYRHRNDPYHRNDLRHRNDPNHHRNDTGGHHRNDPRNIGNGIKRTTKTGQQFSACFLFIYIASFLRCVIYLLPHFILQFILLHEKFLQFDWLRAVVFQLNLKYAHVKITKPLRVVV